MRYELSNFEWPIVQPPIALPSGGGVADLADGELRFLYAQRIDESS
jgi:hypothetical protein